MQTKENSCSIQSYPIYVWAYDKELKPISIQFVQFDDCVLAGEEMILEVGEEARPAIFWEIPND